MGTFQVGLLLIGTFALLLALSVPVSVSIIISSVVTMASTLSLDLGTFVASQRMVGGVDSFSLLAVPFYILCGVLMNTGGIAQKLIDFAKILVGRIPGGLAHTNILGNTLFGSLSGSSVAASVAIGGVLIPMEEKEGYDKKFAAAVNIASAPTGLIIPPSGILIIYPVLAGCSVVGMIMSGYIPGLMWALACMVVAYVIAKKNHYPTAGKVPASVFFKYFVDAIPSLLLIVIIVGGVMSGIFTATESAAVAVAYTLFLSIVVYRSIKIKDLPKILLDACETTAVIMFLIQTIVNFFITSGSGQAAAMMPIMAPLSDLIGVSRQTAILAFQMGDGLSNMIWPTSASMMAYVFAANEKFESYLKFVLPIFLIVSVLGAIMLVIGTAIGY